MRAYPFRPVIQYPVMFQLKSNLRSFIVFSTALLGAVGTVQGGPWNWDIEYLSASAVFSDARAESEIIMIYNISKRDHFVTVFEADCSTPVALEVVNVTTITANFTPASETHDELSVILDLRQGRIMSSPIWNQISKKEANVDMCVRVDLNSTTLGSITFDQVDLSLRIDMFQEFSVSSVDTNTTAQDQADMESGVDYGVEAYQCDASYNRATYEIREDENLHVCIESNSTLNGLLLLDIEILTLYRGGMTRTPIDNYVSNEVTEITGTSTRKIGLTTKPTSLFWNEDILVEPGDMIVSGSVIVVFANETRRLASISGREFRPQAGRYLAQDMATFECQVSLASREDSVSGVVPLLTSDASSRGSFTLLTVVTCFVGIAFMF